ncbi:MAG: hypothetical protein K2M00_02870 [Muribaculaceae bacterium]|nr:hypothetical protein [Muribaculaceae bacterium]
MNKIERSFIVAVLACIALIAAALVLWPGAGILTTAVAAAVIAVSLAIAWRGCPWYSRAGSWVLLIVMTLAILGDIINVNYYTVASGTTASNPVLVNYDACRDWSCAVMIDYGDECPPQFYPGGMSYLVAGLLKVFGRSVAIPIFFNTWCYGFAVMLIAGIGYRLAGNDRRVAFATLLTAVSMCYLFAQSTLIIKDVPLTLGMAAVVYVMAEWAMAGKARPQARQLVMLVAGLLMIALLREHMLLMIAVGAVMFFFGCRYDMRFAALFAGILCLYWIWSNYILAAPAEVINTVTAEAHVEIVQQSGQTAPLDNLIGDYTTLPFYTKILLLPLSVVVQFLIPFPWNFERDIIFGPVDAVAHLGYTWYFAGALILYWLFACVRRTSRPMGVTVIWGIILTCLTAYISSGRVSRYCLPLLPMMLPAAGWVLVNCRRDRALKVWLGVFAVLLAATLVICYKMQKG